MDAIDWQQVTCGKTVLEGFGEELLVIWVGKYRVVCLDLKDPEKEMLFINNISVFDGYRIKREFPIDWSIVKHGSTKLAWNEGFGIANDIMTVVNVFGKWVWITSQDFTNPTAFVKDAFKNCHIVKE